MNRRIKTVLLIMLILAVLPAEAKTRRPRWKFISEKNGTVFYKRINPDGTENLFISNQLLPEEIEKLVPAREIQRDNKKSPPKNLDIDLRELNAPSEDGSKPSPRYKEAKEEPNGTVFIAPTGNSYHSSPDCNSLKRSRTLKRISIRQAKEARYAPCQICKPPEA